MDFAENLVRLQAEHGETNYRLAKSIDVSQTSIKHWRERECYPHPRHIKRIAEHYGVTVSELTGGAQ